MYCAQCGRKASPDQNYCKQCGAGLAKQHKGKQSGSPGKGRRTGSPRRASSPQTSTVLLIGLAIVIGASFVSYIVVNDGTKQREPAAQFSASAIEVASKFYCPCGSCPDLSLDSCGCTNPRGGIAKMREIESEIAKGKSSLQVIKEFQKKYKSIKPEFAYLISQ